jgi:hypothetical protein
MSRFALDVVGVLTLLRVVVSRSSQAYFEIIRAEDESDALNLDILPAIPLHVAQ